ncbi:MAG: murein biosynthesis integral membrane protein MurJ [Solirubrobacterales bacterium]
MEPPRDPDRGPDGAGGLDSFEAAAAAAERAVTNAKERAERVIRSPEATAKTGSGWSGRGEMAVEGGVSSILTGLLVAELEAERSSRQDPVDAQASTGEQGSAGDEAPAGDTADSPAEQAPAGKLARSTAFFSIATAASRVAGLAREIVAASFFGITGPMSAFTVAFQVPNLIRALFADAALQPAFVPIFTEQIEQGKVKEAFRMASTMLLLVTMVLGAITAVFILGAGFIMPLFAPGFAGEIETLMIVLSQIIFPILVLLGVTGVVVGILNSYDRFGAFAISPLFWNLTIIAVVIATVPLFPEEKQIYAYAIGVVAGTVVQLLIPTWDLRHTPFRFTLKVNFKDPNVRRVLLLMIPVTLSLGLINFNLLVNSFFGSLVSDQAPAAIDKAFRIYQLPQGIFSVAIATVLFPTLARFASRGDYENLRKTLGKGMRQIVFVLLPATAAILVLSEPMIRIVFQRGEFGPEQTVLVASALFWFAFSLPTNGMFLLLSRTFFGLQKPWIPTAIAGANLLVTILASYLLYKPYGVPGIVAATAIATTLSVIAQVVLLRRRLGGIEAVSFISTTARVTVGSAVLALVSYESWSLLDEALGRDLVGQIIAVSVALGLGGAAYLACSRLLRIPELDQILSLARRR